MENENVIIVTIKFLPFDRSLSIFEYKKRFLALSYKFQVKDAFAFDTNINKLVLKVV